nr:hypothetical protein [Calditrichia bacterium]
MNPIFTRFLLFSLLIFTWLSARTFEAPVSEPVVNGDNLSVRNIEVQSGDQVQYVFLIKYNQADSRVGEYRLLDSDGLTVAGNELFGDIRVEGLDENDQVATVWVV